jgi:hypothetical protein
MYYLSRQAAEGIRSFIGGSLPGRIYPVKSSALVARRWHVASDARVDSIICGRMSAIGLFDDGVNGSKICRSTQAISFGTA